mgnify:CR=1 FL=1
MRIGHGYDVHRFAKGRKLMLCGVEVDYELGLLGQSDADAALHALADSILGALALGDIGKLFPDSDPRYKDADSALLLAEVMRLAGEKGYELGNCDITIVAQEPKLAPYIESMRRRIAEICGCDIDDVSVKATTEEGLGFTGTLEGIAAHAVCLLQKREISPAKL